MVNARRVVLGALLFAATSCGGADDSGLLSRGNGVAGASAAGGFGGNVSGGAGGASATGGTPAADAGVCGLGKKACNGSCVTAVPEIGCGELSCDPCPAAPANAVPTCLGALCSFACNAGFFRDADACSPLALGAGGSAGAGGGPQTGGAGGAAGAGGTGRGGNGGLNGCPATQPKTGDVCVSFNLSCPYGATTCACLLVLMLPVWACR